MNTEVKYEEPYRQQIQDTLYSLLKHEYAAISLIVVLSTVLNFLLVFLWSDYSEYLFSDMHGYWDRAMQVFSGDEKTLNTWASNAPYYSRFIASVFTWLNFLQLDNLRLETMLSLNVLSSALGTFSLYFIALRITRHKGVGLFLAGSYAFSYPNLYFNTFLLGEPFAIPLVMFSILLLLKYRESFAIISAGLVLAFAVGVRPSNGLLGLPFGLYILFAGLQLKKRSIPEWISVFLPRCLKAGAFSLAFLFVIVGICAENYRVSDGRLAGITAHSGYNFFLGQTQAHKIHSKFDGYEYGFVPSSVAANPEFGTISVTVPIYDSAKFYEMGWEVLNENPHLWWDHLLKYDNLFFNNLFPAVPGVGGFEIFFDPFRYILFVMFLMCALVYIPVREKEVALIDVLFFASIFLLSAAALYFYTVTHQYFMNFSYVVYIIFSVTIFSVLRHRKKYIKHLVVFCTICMVGTLLYQGSKLYSKYFYEENIQLVIEQNSTPIFTFRQPKNISETTTLAVNNLEFFQSEKLTHGTLGELDFDKWFYITARTVMEVEKAGEYVFTFYVDDGYEVFIDGNRVMGFDGLKKMDEYDIVDTYILSEGKHMLEVRHFENEVFSGLMGYYRRIDQEKPNRGLYQPKGGKGALIGEDSIYTRFTMPDDAL